MTFCITIYTNVRVFHQMLVLIKIKIAQITTVCCAFCIKESQILPTAKTEALA